MSLRDGIVVAIGAAIEAQPHHRRLYPDLYAERVADETLQVIQHWLTEDATVQAVTVTIRRGLKDRPNGPQAVALAVLAALRNFGAVS